MKKATVTVSYDEEKLSTLRLYLTEKELQVEEVLIKALDSLFVKAVPQPVQHFLEMKNGAVSSPAAEKPKPVLRAKTRSEPQAPSAESGDLRDGK
jgi:hypothetical protein